MTLLPSQVDPVFVPLLDAVVFHKPRDVTAFVAERCLRQILARGAAGPSGGGGSAGPGDGAESAQREAVRAMMARILGE